LQVLLDGWIEQKNLLEMTKKRQFAWLSLCHSYYDVQNQSLKENSTLAPETYCEAVGFLEKLVVRCTPWMIGLVWPAQPQYGIEKTKQQERIKR